MTIGQALAPELWVAEMQTYPIFLNILKFDYYATNVQMLREHMSGHGHLLLQLNEDLCSGVAHQTLLDLS